MMLRLIPLLLFAFTLNLPAQTVERFIALGDSAQARLDPDAALRAYRQAVRLDPNNAEALWRLSKVVVGMAAVETDEQRSRVLAERALNYAKRSAASDPANAMAQVALAISNGQLAILAPATEKLELSKKIKDHAFRAMQLDPSNHVAMMVLGIWNREVAALSWVIKLTMKVVYGGVPEASMEESKRLLAKAVSIQPDEIMSRLELAKTLIELDEESVAIAHLRRVLTLPQRHVGDSVRLDEARKLLRELT